MSWFARRRRGRAERASRREAWREQAQAEYVARMQSGDPEVREAARDYGDHDVVPWRTEVGTGLAFLALLGLMLVVGVLIAFFSVVKTLVSG